MYSHAVTVTLLVGLVTATAATNGYVQPIQDKAASNLLSAEPAAVLTRKSNCTFESAGVRKNWEVLSKRERKEYIKAVKCLLSSPSQTDPSLETGARVRYDDWALQHINQTRAVHITGNFLTWHRHYIWTYEQALRDECGYTGHLPYWNWFKHQDNLRLSPVFDGSDTSMGSDGAFVAHNGSNSGTIPSGLGGGCIERGPFANQTANLGPVTPGMDGMVGVGDANKLKFNRHCVTRDLSSWLAQRIFTKEALHNATIGETAKDIAGFQREFDRQSSGLQGMHSGGHGVLGGSNSDLYSGVVDPAFYVHHAMVDRIYWMWQALHPEQARTISGTVVFGNTSGRNTTLDDLLELPYLGSEPLKIRDALDTLDGPYCYRYE